MPFSRFFISATFVVLLVSCNMSRHYAVMRLNEGETLPVHEEKLPLLPADSISDLPGLDLKDNLEALQVPASPARKRSKAHRIAKEEAQAVTAPVKQPAISRNLPQYASQPVSLVLNEDKKSKSNSHYLWLLLLLFPLLWRVRNKA